jgi:DNA-directed DNA polymerase III PolC
MIVHLDADAFFASVEQAADVRLRGKPVAVGGSKRGVGASASYEARRLGIYTTMPTARARKLCPSLITVSGDFEKYEKFSRLMFSYAYDHTPVVEVASIDEGYFDLKGNCKRSAREAAEFIRTAIRQSLKISVSEGIARNKLVSAVASKLKKPSCFIEIQEGREREFLFPLENKWLPGVGPAMAKTLNQAGLARIGQIAEVLPQQLSLFAGKGARQLWEFARGIDDRLVIPEAPAAKSWSSQETFTEDVTNEDWVLAKLRSIADRLFGKVRAEGKTVRTIEVRVRYNDFDDCRRSESLEEPTDLETDSYSVLSRLLKKAWQRRVSLRLVSVKLSGVYGVIFQCSLPLLNAGIDSAQRRRLSPILDRIKGRYGDGAIMRGHDLFLQTYGQERQAAPLVPKKRVQPVKLEWAALNCKSAFSFMDSLLKPEALVKLANAHGCQAVAMTDANLHGAVEFFMASKHQGMKPIIAAEVMADGKSFLAYVKDARGYQNLCAALSQPSRVLEGGRREGLILRPAGWLPEVRYADPSERPMFNILQSIRTLSLLDERNPQKRKGHFHFPSPEELTTHADALRDSLEIAEQCNFEFDLRGLRFPRYYPSDGSTAHDFLRRLTMEGVQRRYAQKPRMLTQVLSQIEEELGIIAEVGYEEYFLLTWEILEDCKAEGIEWITRGSAADSLVCYCLGISDVCPIRFELYFRRFLNRDRMVLNKLPDIDIDFAHDRKNDVVDLIFKKYGEHAAIVGGFSTYRGKSAFADIAKVMGVSEYQIRRMTERLPWTDATNLQRAVQESQECRDLDFSEDPYQTALRLAHRLDGFPKNPKMHPCGVVLSRSPVTCLTPVFTSAKGYPTTHLDMEQVEAIGLVKMDILAQGGLAVMRDTKRMIAARGIEVDLKGLEPWDHPEVWQMIAAGEARGVHHIESPAMCTLERMVNVNNVDDLIAIVSVIRPGAANNLKKEQFALRAQGLEPVDYVHPSLERALRSTYGVVAYEEHILQICQDFAGLSAGPADILRRALVKCQQEKIIEIGREFVAAAQAIGRTPDEIKAVWALVRGFQGYAFCRAHSTAYGVEAYQAAWLKRHHPAEFLAAVLTNGKGFYSKLVYSIECRRLGLGFRPPDVNRSQNHFFPEGNALRVPLFQIKGLSQRLLQRWERGKPYESLRDFYVRTTPSTDEMDNLIRTGAFDAFGQSRTEQFWQFKELAQWPGIAGQGLLLAGDEKPTLPDVPLEEPSLIERLKAEQDILGFPVTDHPLALFPDVCWDSYCPIVNLKDHHGKRVSIAGMIIEDRIHRQEDGRPMKFISVCDATGIIECELFADVYRRFGIETVRNPVIEIVGKVMPFANGNGHTLQVQRVGRARTAS